MREQQQVASVQAYRQEGKWSCHVPEPGTRPIGLKGSEQEGEGRSIREMKVMERSCKGGKFETVLSVYPEQDTCTVIVHSSSTGVGDHSG